jgi:hypothetical protein
MCAAFTQWKLVMDFLHQNQRSTLVTQFTERMLCSILVTDSFPGSAVSFLCRPFTAILLIIMIHQSLMLRTIPSVCKIRAATIITRMFWFLRQCTSPLFLCKRALKDFSLKAPYHFAFRIITISYLWTLILSHQLSTFRKPSISFNPWSCNLNVC